MFKSFKGKKIEMEITAYTEADSETLNNESKLLYEILDNNLSQKNLDNVYRLIEIERELAFRGE